MNIQAAKKEIKNTIELYLMKDEVGSYIVPIERQRPIYLHGGPGIGKTAIVKQIADEMDIGFVSYTITHHTRQSAIGLPFIQKKVFSGREYSVTEYTLSEIIASVYDAIENQSQEEGILFIDEINCVSETLLPAMLELLQNKCFGPHQVPSGWIIVSAGNPIEYNRSARDFDMVILDRVKKMDVDTEIDTWKTYAYQELINEAIIYYLQLRPQYLFQMETTVEGISFVTPRGWEDLSVVINQYQQLGYELTVDHVNQYVQNKSIALEFYRYYLLFQKYKEDYQVYEILKGKGQGLISKLRDSNFDEKMAVIEVFVSVMNSEAEQISSLLNKVKHYTDLQKKVKPMKEDTAREYLEIQVSKHEKGSIRLNLGVIFSKLEEAQIISSYKAIVNKNAESTSVYEEIYSKVRELRKDLKSKSETISGYLSELLSFMDQCFGHGQELVALLVGLISSVHFIRFISAYPSDQFYKYNEVLLVDHKSKQILQEIELLKSEMEGFFE